MHSLRRFLAVALFLLFAGNALAQFPKVDPNDSRNNPVILQAFRSIVAKSSESAVRVLADGKEVAFGTVVDANGWILTKWDEIRDREKIVCKFKDGKEFTAKLVGADPEHDLAMLKIDAKGLKVIEWRPSKDAKPGRWVASVGQGIDPVAIGVVSVGTRPHKPGDQPPKNINLNSGYLGVGLEAGMGGAKITKVDDGTPAKKAGLKVNDLIYEAAGKKIVDHEALINTIGRLKAGEKVLLKLKRGEENVEINATLGKRPLKMFGNPQELMGSELSNRRGGFPFILQHDTVLKPKDCGGPLVDLEGKAVGINIARAGRTETYAIPSEEIQKLLPDLKSGKLLPKVEITKVDAPKDEILRLTGNLNAKDPLSTFRKDSHMKVHEVKLTAGTTYVIEMQSKEIDAYLILEDAKNNKLAEDNDSGGGKNARITFKATQSAGHRVIVTSYLPNEIGAYTLIVRQQTEQPKK